eukprot:CCRYP_007468-RA/>CCRYP_007468-RA protein AED:0.19 eAED:0.19 QI:569/1/1/1/0.22/0.4/10/1187/437
MSRSVVGGGGGGGHQDNNDEEYVDDDGYVYYPGFQHEWGFVHTGENHYELSPPRYSPRNGTTGSTTSVLGERKFKRSIEDLYPEDFREVFKETKWDRASRSLEVGTDDNDEEVEEPPPPLRSDTDGSLFESAVEEMTPVGRESTSDFLQPVEMETIEPNGKDANHDDHTNVIEVPPTVHDSTKDEEEPLKYPYRLVTFFLPPGFHNWSNALGFLREFFFLPQCSRRIAKAARGALFGRSNGRNDTSTPPSRSQRLQIHDDFVVLRPAEEELLRCAGLDTYLLIRFARFGFDVCFYPFLFACVTVIPIYISCIPGSVLFLDANGEMVASASVLIDGFFSLTINRIESGSSKMYGIIVCTFFLYFFVLRRLWLEWEVFIKLRHRFLSNGDQNFHDNPTYLKKFRNTVVVECVPKTQRSDRHVRQVFEQLFPVKLRVQKC